VNTTPVRRAWRNLIWLLVLIVGLIGINAGGVIWGGGSWTPKLALDLQGGTQIILTPQITDGSSVSPEQLTQAVAIIRQRVDSAGVSEAEINTQGTNNIVVSIPGTPDQDTINRIEASAKLDFRAVIETTQATKEFVGEDGKKTPNPAPPTNLPSTPSVKPTDASDPAWVTPELQAQYDVFNCDSDAAKNASAAPADKPLITCDVTKAYKFLLGPVEVTGADITDATSGVIQTSTGSSTGQWAVYMTFNPQGTAEFAKVTTRLSGLTGARNQFAIVLDGQVISAPATQSAITDGKPQISGGFTQQSAKTLADQLKYGALPIGFKVQSSDTISATLGSTQLYNGLLAGLIGLILVVVYSLIQYRALGFVTVFSLGVAAVVTYLLVTILSWYQGYRLSLAGVAGLIVAIGITADSFIVLFERIRDELREGRGLESAVESGWRRAIRTIIASDAVNFLAALVLFILAVGNVRGFALTLGLTTVVDLVVVALFTHPIMTLLAQTRFFAGGHPASGLDPQALGAVYRGRGQFVTAADARASKVASSSKEAAKRQTIAERKAAMLEQDGADNGKADS
jgi:preprotein translocase subunit SecD